MVSPIFEKRIFHGPFGDTSDDIKMHLLENIKWGFPDEKFYKEIVKKIQTYSMLDYGGLMTNALLATFCETSKIKGDFVETGCWRGGSGAMLAAANLQNSNLPRELHLFDSFEGLPFPDPKRDTKIDPHWFENHIIPDMTGREGELTSSKGLTGASVEDVQTIVNETIGYPKEHTHIHKGWFQDTLPEYESLNRPIALLRLDGDLYDSTQVVLEALFPLVVSGGFVIIDDWCLPGAKTAVFDYFEKENISLFPNIINPISCYFIKP